LLIKFIRHAESLAAQGVASNGGYFYFCKMPRTAGEKICVSWPPLRPQYTSVICAFLPLRLIGNDDQLLIIDLQKQLDECQHKP